MEIENLLTLKQVDTLINNVPKLEIDVDKKSLKLLLKMTYHGMMKATEIYELTSRDIEIVKKEIRVRATKGGKTTTVVFSLPSLWNEIAHHIKDLQPNQKLFSIDRKMQWFYVKKLGEISDIKINRFTKETDNVSPKDIAYSRKLHLDNSGLFRESELDQLSRNYNALRERGLGEQPYSIESLKRKEEESNKILLTYCESCNFRNPDRAIFCCLCSKSLSEGKSIIRQD